MSTSEEVRQLFEDAKKDYEEIGGLKSFRSGQWLFEIIQRSFKSYWENANVEYFEAKYGTSDKVKLARKLTSVTARRKWCQGQFLTSYHVAQIVPDTFSLKPSLK